MSHAYPAELAAYVRERWTSCESVDAARDDALPLTTPLLEQLLSIAYQASLLKEEERPVTFRLIVGNPSSFASEAGPPAGLHRLLFTRPRPLDEHELRRLSPAAKYHRALIGVGFTPEAGFTIWGILQSGARWLRDAHGGRRTQQQSLPRALIVRATGPGRLSVVRGAETLGELRAGRISRPSMDVFQSKWLAGNFAETRGELDVLHEAARAEAHVPWAVLDKDVTKIVAQQMFKRIIATMRSTHHGGLLLILPPQYAAAVTAQNDFLRLKYTFEDDEPRRRYRTLAVRAMNALAEHGASLDPVPDRVGFSHYETTTSLDIANLDEAIFEMSHLIAGLADVDGAVVLTKRFELLGFGAEIRGGDLADVLTVQRALDLEGDDREPERTDGVGTRHRSAYRLCQHLRGALAVVVSQDGGVRFVTWNKDAVTYWDHVSGGAPEL